MQLSGDFSFLYYGKYLLNSYNPRIFKGHQKVQGAQHSQGRKLCQILYMRILINLFENNGDK